MIAAWSKTRAVTRSTSWDELRTRTNQGVSKRLDLARYRFGLLSDPYESKEPRSTGGRFFFSADDLPRLDALYRQHLKEEAGEVIREAEELYGHRF